MSLDLTTVTVFYLNFFVAPIQTPILKIFWTSNTQFQYDCKKKICPKQNFTHSVWQDGRG